MPTERPPARFTFDGLAKVLAKGDQSRAHRPPAVVASVFQTGLNLMRDLEQKGIRVVGIDCNSENPGFRSRYGRSFLCPNPDKNPDDWAVFMLALSEAIGEKPILIAASDIFVSAIGRHAELLSSHFIFSKTGCKLQASLATKETQYALAREFGHPSPLATHVQSEVDLIAFCQQARFPALLKPLHHREWQALPPGNPLAGLKTISANSADELLSHYRTVRTLVPNAVAQEEIVGPDSAKYCYLSAYAQSGQRLGFCVVRELRAYPLLYGCATLVEPVVDDEIEQACNKFLSAIGYIGLCEIELKRDTRDGQLRLIEVNPRFSGTGDSARYAGVETGYIHYLDLIGQTPGPVEATEFGFRHIMLCADFAAFPKYLEENQITWSEWLRSLSGHIEYFDLDRSDFANARRTAVEAARALFGGLWHTRKRRT
jgi:D-aspartate ligase